jgi:hypothetical protein
MAYRASTRNAVLQAYASINEQMLLTKKYMNDQADLMFAATVSAWIPLQVIQHLRDVIARFDVWAATPGLAAFAQAVENDPAYDAVAEYLTTRDTLVSARDQLISMFPKSTGGYLAFQTMDAIGNMDVRTFTNTQLAPVVTLCRNVAATIV